LRQRATAIILLGFKKGGDTTMMRVALAAILALAASPAAALAEAEAPVVAEARTFMDAYARDLLAGDRPAIAGRYSRSGAYAVGWSAKRFDLHDAIVANYAGDQWQKPESFAWRDLSFEPVGPDAVAVIGNFEWGRGGERRAFAYSALLRRENGTLRIRVEHENLLPRREPQTP